MSNYEINTTNALVLTKPEAESAVVYVFWLGTQCQYVGKSLDAARPLSSRHEVKALPGFDYDRLEIFRQPDEDTALVLEGIWIDKLQPRFNVAGRTRKGGAKEWRLVQKHDSDSIPRVYSVVRGGLTLFSSMEKFERDRFFMQERLRESNAHLRT